MGLVYQQGNDWLLPLVMYYYIHRYVIHTVGPRYNAKYRTAAESALYNCYRNVLQIVR